MGSLESKKKAGLILFISAIYRVDEKPGKKYKYQ